MMELEFYLEQAKATEDGRLSVSQETKSEIVGERNLKQEALVQMIYWDYGKLLQEVFGTEQEGFGLSDKNEGRERLALVAAVGCEESRFDSVLQRFTMGLWDKKGNRLSIALRYSKEEQYTIRVLERLSSRLKKQGMKHMVFFGIPYLEQGELFLYPIEFFEGGPWEDGLIDMGAEVSAQMEMDDPGKREQGSCLPLDSKVLAEMERFLKELRQVSADLFQSGLASVQEEALQILHRLAEESEQLGLHGAAKELGILEEGLQSKRHRMDFEPEPIIRAWIRFYRYLRAGRGKVSLDQALVNLQKEYETHV